MMTMNVSKVDVCSILERARERNKKNKQSQSKCNCQLLTRSMVFSHLASIQFAWIVATTSIQIFDFLSFSSSSSSMARLHSPIHASYHSSFFRHISYQINNSPRKSKSNWRFLLDAYVQEKNPIQSISPFDIRRPSFNLPCWVNSLRRAHVSADRADLNVSTSSLLLSNERGDQADLHPSMWLNWSPKH